jgi:hypothetical protein
MDEYASKSEMRRIEYLKAHAIPTMGINVTAVEVLREFVAECDAAYPGPAARIAFEEEWPDLYTIYEKAQEVLLAI